MEPYLLRPEQCICVYDLLEKWIFFGRMKEGGETENSEPDESKILKCSFDIIVGGTMVWLVINGAANLYCVTDNRPMF